MNYSIAVAAHSCCGASDVAAGGSGRRRVALRMLAMGMAAMRVSAMRWSGGAAALLLGAVVAASAQSCTTQAKMAAEQRQQLAAAALQLATQVQSGQEAEVQADTVPEVAASFAGTAALIRSTAAQVAGDQLAVTQLYALDARNRHAGDAGEAEFSCPLSGTTAETDFAIPGLPPGTFAFAMVEATGHQPWLLAFLLQRSTAGRWQLAGFFPRRREAAGHDGLWYWRQAQEDVRDKHGLLAWLLFGEADELLRPANFVTSTNLDRLRAERRAAAPPELSEGLSAQTPLVVQAGGHEVRVTGLAAQASDDGAELILTAHIEVPADDPTQPPPGSAAAQTANKLAAQTLIAAHPELRPAFGRLLVIAEVAGQAPVVTDQAMIQVP